MIPQNFNFAIETLTQNTMVFDPCSAGFLMGPQNRESLGESLRESLGQFLGESLRQVLASSPFLKPLVQMCYVSCIKITLAP